MTAMSDARYEAILDRRDRNRHFRDLHIATFVAIEVAPAKRKHRAVKPITRPTEIIRPCTMGCGTLTRHSNQRLADYPGTKFRRPGGACTTCAYRAAHPESKVRRIEVDIVRVRQLRAAGMTVIGIAAAMGCSKSKVSRDLALGTVAA